MSNFGDFRILGTPGGDLGFQGLILGPTPGESRLFGHHCGTFFGHFWVLLLRYFFGRRLDHVLDDFGMVPGSILGSFRHI